jgi:outer membrane protein
VVKQNTLSVLAVLMAIVFFLPATAHAEKVGFVDVREVIAKSESGKKAQEELKNIVDKKKALIQQKETELKNRQEAFDKQRPGLSETAAKEKELELQKAIRDYQRIVNDAKEEINLKDQALSRDLIPEILKVINAIAQRDGYTLILDTNNPVVIYSSRTNNITDMVVSEFNKMPVRTNKSGDAGKSASKSKKN